MCQRVAIAPWQLPKTSAPVCTLQETSLDGCISLFALPAACAFAALRGRRRGRRAACLRSTERASRWHAGAAGESFQEGHGRGAGRRRWVGAREKWLVE